MTWRRLVREIAREYQSVRPLRYHRSYPSDLSTGASVPGDQIIDIGPPEYMGWEVLALHWQISAVAGPIFPTINIVDKSGAVILPIHLMPVNKGDILLVYFMQGGAFGVQSVPGIAGQLYPLPMDGELKSERLQLYCDGGVAADEHSAIVYYEEFDWPPGRDS